MRTRLLIVAIALTVQGLAAQTAPILIDIVDEDGAVWAASP